MRQLFCLLLLISLMVSGCARRQQSRVWHLPRDTVGIEHGPESGFRKLTNVLTRSIETKTNFSVFTRPGKKGDFIISADGKIIYDHKKEKKMLSEDELIATLLTAVKKREPLVPTNQGSSGR